MTDALRPLVSVVMPSFNHAAFISESIDSVLSQDYRNLELVVADGGSSDGTLEILRRKQAEDDRVRWFSEPDKGPADALNKAFKAARGTYFGWLNSDDLYTPACVSRAMLAFDNDPESMLVYGQGQHVDIEGNIINTYPTRPPETPVAEFRDGCFICQPTMYLKRSAWVILGELDLSLQTAFDFDYWVRAFLAFPGRIGFVDSVQAYSRLHDECITMKMRRTVAVEGMRLLAQHLGDSPGHWLLTYVNEMLRVPTEARGFDHLRRHIDETFADVAGFMSPVERESIRAFIAADRRLDENNASIRI